MTFSQIPQGTALFVDANPFVYHLGSDPVLQPACQQLLDRVARQELVAFTSSQFSRTLPIGS